MAGRPTVRLRRLKFQLGDAIVFQGRRATIYETLAALGCLPLAERQLAARTPPPAADAAPILALAMAMAAFRLVPAEIAFVAAALAIVILGLLTLERGLCRDRVADPDHDRRADTDRRGGQEYRDDRPARRPDCGICRASPALRILA